MRLSSFAPVAVLLISSFVFAQHHESPAAPSAPPPSPPPAAAAAPTPATTPTPASAPATFTSGTPAAHVSEPSAPAASNFSAAHVAPGVSSAPAPATAPTPARGESNAPRISEPAFSGAERVNPADRVAPNEKISGENRISSEPRIGEVPQEKRNEPNNPESDLKRRVCPDGNCKESGPRTTAPESDLRHRVCLTGACTCGEGQALVKGQCVSTAANDTTCPAGEVWNGGSCLPTGQCQAGENWDGSRCIDYSAACATNSSRAATIISEIRSLRAASDRACTEDPQGQDCSESKGRLDGAQLRYRMLLNESSPDCRAQMPDPLSLQSCC